MSRILTSSEEKLLNRTELDRISRACQKHNDVMRLVRDLRAIRSLREKSQDKARAVRRDKKSGSPAINTRHADKKQVFDKVVKILEARLEKLRDTAASECPARGSSRRHAKARDLLSRAQQVISQEVRTLRDSHSINGVLVDKYGVVEEVASLEALDKEIRAFLRNSRQ